MTGRLEFLRIGDVDAAAELKAMLDDLETYDDAWTLFEHLRKTAGHAARHNARAHVWKPFAVSAQRIYPVFITAADPFVVYLVAQIAETREYKVLAILFGRFIGEPAEAFYDRVWNEAERRLRLYNW